MPDNKRIEEVTKLIEEYADCREELSPHNVARAIDALYKHDTDIAGNMEDYWASQRCGAER